MYNVFAVFPPGIEQAMQAELQSLGINSATPNDGGIEFQASQEDLMRVNLWSRIATRFLVRIAEFPATHLSELERNSKKVDWKAYIPPNSTLHVKTTCKKSKIYHSAAATERIFKSVERSVSGATLTLPTEEADQGVFVRIHRNRCTISLDSAGAPLYQRGYKTHSVAAPLRENLAAAFLWYCDWEGDLPLVDPMAGSGTLPIEAALLAGNRAPGLHEQFAFLKWPSANQSTWKKLIQQAQDVALPIPNPIWACDRDPKAIAAIQANAANAGLSEDISIAHRPFHETITALPKESGVLVFNPPYGKRIGSHSPLRDLFHCVNQSLNNELHHWTVGMIAPKGMLSAIVEPSLIPYTPPVFHGGIRIYLFGKSGSGTSHDDVVE